MKTKILVVDDEPDALEVLGFKLREAGFTPIFARDGARAIAVAREEHPDLIVLDLMLPEVDGLEVCKILRRDASTSSIPVIMLTARAAEMDRVLGLELRREGYMTKPFSPREPVGPVCAHEPFGTTAARSPSRCLPKDRCSLQSSDLSGLQGSTGRPGVPHPAR